MTAQPGVPDDMIDLLQGMAIAQLATVMPDGTPQQTAVWIDYDGEHLLVNTLADRLKLRNMRDRPKVSVSVLDPADPNRWLSVRGLVTEITEGGAADHIDQLARRYLGLDGYPAHDPQRPRQLVKIQPTHITAQRAITDFR